MPLGSMMRADGPWPVLERHQLILRCQWKQPAAAALRKGRSYTQPGEGPTRNVETQAGKELQQTLSLHGGPGAEPNWQ